MSVIVVGGDYLGLIEKNLQAWGVTQMTHISGRKPANKGKINLPENTAFVLVFTDYVNHGTAHTVKHAAKSKEIPVIFSRRSWPAVEEKLQICKGMGALRR